MAGCHQSRHPGSCCASAFCDQGRTGPGGGQFQRSLSEMAQHQPGCPHSHYAESAKTGARQYGSIDRKSVVEGTRVSVRVELGGRRILKKKNTERIADPHKECNTKQTK